MREDVANNRSARLLARALMATALVLASQAAVSAGPAGAATATVVVDDMAFTPKVLTAAQGTTVVWNFRENGHNTVSRQRFWASSIMTSGRTFSAMFPDAGRFGYVCTPHESMGMVGAIVIPMRKAGSSADGWTLRWSSRTWTPSTRSFDVRYKVPGSTTWRTFRSSTTGRSTFFNPSRTGTYYFQARTDNRSNGMSSAWSPTLTVTIS